MNIETMLKNVKSLHSNIAVDVWPDGCKKICQICGKTINLTTEDCGYCLAHGWPECCGHEMQEEK